MLGLWIPLSCKQSVWETENQTLSPQASNVWSQTASAPLSPSLPAQPTSCCITTTIWGVRQLAPGQERAELCCEALYFSLLCSAVFPGSWWKPLSQPNSLCTLPSFLVSPPAFQVPSVLFILWSDHSIRDHLSLITFDDLIHGRAASAHPPRIGKSCIESPGRV